MTRRIAQQLLHFWRSRTELRVVTLYLFAGLLWLLGTDLIARVFLAENEAALQTLEIAEDWGFVAASSLLLIWALRRERGHNALLNAIGDIAAQLFRAPWPDNITPALSRLGAAARVSRVYLFEKHIDEQGQLRVTQRYEWVEAGISAQIDNPNLQNMDFAAAGFSRWIPIFDQGQTVAGPVRTLPHEEQMELRAEGIRSIICTPVMIGNDWWGFLGLDDCILPRSWSSAEIDALRTTASLIGITIQRAGTIDAAQSQLGEIMALNVAAVVASQAASRDELFDQISQTAQRSLPGDTCGILLVDKPEQRLTAHPSYRGVPDGTSLTLPLGAGLAGRVAQTNRGGYTSDTSEPERDLQIAGMRAQICAPIIANQRLIGTIHLSSRRARAFGDQHLRLLNAIANTLTTALEKLEFVESERQRRREAETLYQSAAIVSTSLELRPVLDTILTAVQRVVPYDSASIYLIEGDHNLIVAEKGFQRSDEFVEHIETRHSLLFDEIRKTAQYLIIPDVNRDNRFEPWSPNSRIRGWMGIPLIARDQVIGFLTLDSHQPGVFNENLAFLAQTFAHQAAAAIQNASLFEAEARRREEAETLRQAAAAISTSLDLPTVLETILNSLRQVVAFESASVFLVEKTDLRLAAAHGLTDPAQVGTLTAKIADDPFFAEIERKNAVVLLKDASQDARFHNWGRQSTRGWMGVPLSSRGALFGYLTLDSDKPGAFDEHAADQVQAFAYQAAAAIENARLYEQAIRAAERRMVLHRVSQDLVRSLREPEEIYRGVHRAIRELMPCDAFVIALRNADFVSARAVYVFEEDRRLPGQEIPAGRGLTNQVIAEGKTLLFDDLSISQSAESIHFGTPRHVRTVLATPMKINERVIGVISTQCYQPNAYSEEEQTLLEMLTAYATTAIENARLFTETQNRLSELEGMTRVSATLRVSETMEEMMPRLMQDTVQLVRAGTGAIWLYDPAQDIFLRAADHGWFHDIPEQNMSAGRGIVGHVFQTGQPYVIQDLRNDPHTYRPERIPEGWSGIAMPLRTAHETVGVMFLGFEHPRALYGEESKLLTAIAEMAGNAIHRATLYQQAGQQVRRLTALRDIDIAIASSFDLRVTLNILVEQVISQLRIDAANILLYHSATQTLSYATGRGFRTPGVGRTHQRIGEGLPGRAVLERHLVQVDDLPNDKRNVRQVMTTEEGFITYLGAPLIAKGQIKGVLEIFHRSVLNPSSDWLDFLQTLAGQAAIAIDNSQLFDNLQYSNQELALAYDTTLEGWGRALELRDKETQGHTRRVSDLTLKLAERMGFSAQQLVHIRRGVLLHDIGKMGVPDQILHKTGPLDEQEWHAMRKHPQLARDLLEPITYLRTAIDIPYCHHEHWDGSGYPRGLRGEEIPLPARIFSVVDAWDALRSDRPYRKAWSRRKTTDYLRKQAGKEFDPTVVDVFLDMIADIPD